MKIKLFLLAFVLSSAALFAQTPQSSQDSDTPIAYFGDVPKENDSNGKTFTLSKSAGDTLTLKYIVADKFHGNFSGNFIILSPGILSTVNSSPDEDCCDPTDHSQFSHIGSITVIANELGTTEISWQSGFTYFDSYRANYFNCFNLRTERITINVVE